jgi:hypothetical protein
VAGIDSFCHAYYLRQRTTVERYPYPTPADYHRADVQLMTDDHELLARLERLQPPPALSGPFAQFLANEQRLGQARTREARLDPSVRSEGLSQVDAAITARHADALPLGARGCDGVLPPKQWVQAVRAAQRFDLSSRVHQVCVDLVDPSFLPSRYPRAGNRLAACAREFRRHRAGDPKPRNIVVSDVSGVENISATVHFQEVPDCGCGNLVIRIFHRHGQWLVSETDAE